MINLRTTWVTTTRYSPPQDQRTSRTLSASLHSNAKPLEPQKLAPFPVSNLTLRRRPANPRRSRIPSLPPKIPGRSCPSLLLELKSPPWSQAKRPRENRRGLRSNFSDFWLFSLPLLGGYYSGYVLLSLVISLIFMWIEKPKTNSLWEVPSPIKVSNLFHLSIFWWSRSTYVGRVDSNPYWIC